MRRRTIIACAAVAVAGVTTTGAAVTGRAPTSDAAPPAGAAGTGPTGTGPADTSAPTGAASGHRLATVAQRDLLRSHEFDGTIGRGTPRPLSIPGSGTLTRLPAPGDTIGPGQPIAEVDGRPVVLLPGERPAWRDLGPGTSDGEDVRQLEQALTDLGYATAALEVDDHWTSATTASVKAFQDAVGQDDDGRLRLGEVLFAPTPARVATVGGHLGDEAGSAGIEVTGEAQVIEVDADADDADLLTPGTEVTIELPGGSELPGTVFTVEAPQAADGGDVTVPVIVLADGLDATALDGLTVDVTVSTVRVAAATAVPVEALLALAEGGYALELPDASSPTGTRLVGVEVGVFDEDGWVQVSGNVAPGDQVVVP